MTCLKKYLLTIMDNAPHYCHLATALNKTIEIQEKIDNIYPNLEKELIDFE